jgi:dTDP-4-dehydrorhamnose reductase
VPRVLIVGASGQLGLELQRARIPADWTLICPTRDQLDLTDTRGVAPAVAALAPDAIINAAAYTGVDKAESEPDAAFALNRDGPAALARATGAPAPRRHAPVLAGAAPVLQLPLVHVSTDYVFSGDKPTPYVETDAMAPTSVYGRSKAEGEALVLAAHPHAAIVRSSWVYSPHRANFVKTMLRLGETRDEVSVVADQIGRPTAAADLATACIAITQRLLAGDAVAQGVFHYAGAGDTSWAEFAEAIFAEAALRGRVPVRVKRITTAEFPTPARRPANSRLDTSKIERLGITPRPWREALRLCLDELLVR